MKFDQDEFNAKPSILMFEAQNESQLTNVSRDRLLNMEDTNNTQSSLPGDWSYNYWPLIIAIMPLITVGGNLLVIVSDYFLIFCS